MGKVGSLFSMYTVLKLVAHVMSIPMSRSYGITGIAIILVIAMVNCDLILQSQMLVDLQITAWKTHKYSARTIACLSSPLHTLFDQCHVGPRYF